MDAHPLVAELRPLLMNAARDAFRAVQLEHTRDQFYAFALYTSGGLDYVGPSSNTEEGLSEAVASYLKRDESESAEQHRATLRWSPCDWAHHMAHQEVFAEFDRRLYEGRPDLDEAAPNELKRFAAGLLGLCFDVLRCLDGEGLFGRGLAREGVVLNVLKGDQSDKEQIEWARVLNPPATAERFAKEVAQGTEVWLQKWG